MNKWGAILLLIFVLFIAFIYWYFISKNACEPITQCRFHSTNITCISDSNCFSGSYYGTCNTNTFKCVNMILDKKDKESCLNVGGEWIEGGC